MKRELKRSFFAGLVFLMMAAMDILPAHAVIFDRVVAFVDNEAVTLSELDEQYERTLKVTPLVSREEVLDTMINRILLLKEARKYRIEAQNQDEMLKEYINLKVRAFIRVADAAVEEFYRNNTAQFAGRGIEDVRVEIETFLTEKALNERLKELLQELRKSAYIRVQLNQGHTGPAA